MKLVSINGAYNTGGYVELLTKDRAGNISSINLYHGGQGNESRKELANKELDELIDILVSLRSSRNELLINGYKT